MKIIGIIIAALFGLALIVYAGISIYIATQLTKSVPSPVTQDPTVVTGDYEDVFFTSSDNFNLKGWLFKNETSNKLIIFVAGTNNNRANAEYGTLQIASELYTEGYSILLFDRRTTGESDGNRITFGGQERLDVIAAVKFAESEGYLPENIGIIANSMGAIATLMGIEDLKNVGAIVLDSPAARVKPIVESIMKNEQHLPTFLNPGIFMAAKLLYGIDLDSIEPVKAVALASDKTLLYLHGENDTVIPKTNSEELLSASNLDSKLVIFPGAAHAQTYKSNPGLYKFEVFVFLADQLNQ